MGVQIVISETEPEKTNKYTWCKPLADGGKEWYELADGGWKLVGTDIAPAALAHSHATHGDINFIGTVSVNGDEGVTGQKTIGGFRITFKNGILTGFDPI